MNQSYNTKVLAIAPKATKKQKAIQHKTLDVGTIVVHNYNEFAHGTILKHLGEDTYEVYFPADMAPRTPKYQAQTSEAYAARIRTLRFNKGFFVSKHKSFESIRALQRKYKARGLSLEAVA